MKFADYFRELTGGPVGEPIDRAFDFPPLPKREVMLVRWLLNLNHWIVWLIIALCFLSIFIIVFYCVMAWKKKRKFIYGREIMLSGAFLLSVLVICFVLLSYSAQVRSAMNALLYDQTMKQSCNYNPYNSCLTGINMDYSTIVD